MNYIRGAYQYYRDLPPINAATLTGAIDVIVIERPAEPGDVGAKQGDSVLSCTPFHVRFGKLSILRPADNQVTVVVNGKITQFPMKIGEAGEAFFVCETEEDVPQEMLTSPILAASEPEKQQEPRTERFGAKAKDEGMKDVERPERPVSPDPPFLDLNNTAAGSDAQSPSFPSTSRPSTPGSRSSTPPTSLSASSQQDRKSARSSSQPPSASSPEAEHPNPSKAVDRLVQGPEHEKQPPEVDYKADVVLDMEGYHAHPSAAPNLGKEDDLEEDAGEPGQSRSWTDRLLGKGKPNVEDEETGMGMGGMERRVLPPIRALSEPPDIGHEQAELEADTSLTTLRGVSEEPEGMAPSTPSSGIQHLRNQAASSAPALPHLTLSEIPPPNTMTDYTWEWGALPTPRTARPREIEEEEKGMLGVGGKIYPKTKGGELFGLEVDDKRTTFELSLCGGEAVRGSEFENASAFAAKLVTYKEFVESETVVDDPNLVIRWDEKYITRDDSSPLFPALARWRLEAAPVDLASGSPDRQPSPPASLSRASTTSWTRWWSRRPTQDVVPKTGNGELTKPQDLQMRRGNSSPPPTIAESPAPMSESTPNLLEAAAVPEDKPKKTFAKTLRLTSDQLKQLQLKPGPNSVSFSLAASTAVICTARIFLWRHTDQLVVSDIDGTITKSDALGHLYTMIGRDWTHSGVAKLYTDICRNGYKIMYLTSRAIGQADSTRDYLKGINQDNYQLPEGPVVMSPDRLIASLHREVVLRKPEVFKMACLRDIQRLFGEANKHPFYAGFGNRITDALSYRSVNIPSGRIFTIDSSGVVKMELLELAGYKSSYIHMTDLVDQMFPPVHRKWAQEFTDLNYWRTPMANIDIPDLRPPSPALSARSDTSSRLTRITRNFTLGLPGSRTSVVGGTKSGDSTPNGTADVKEGKPVRPTSPLVSAYTAESLSEDEDFNLSRSPTDTHSMPGSMPGSPEPDSGSWMPRRDDEEDYDQEEGETEEPEEDEWPAAPKPPADHEYDDDLLATGEMENVPFL